MEKTASSLAQLTTRIERNNIVIEGREPTSWDAAPPIEAANAGSVSRR